MFDCQQEAKSEIAKAIDEILQRDDAEALRPKRDLLQNRTEELVLGDSSFDQLCADLQRIDQDRSQRNAFAERVQREIGRLDEAISLFSLGVLARLVAVLTLSFAFPLLGLIADEATRLPGGIFARSDGAVIVYGLWISIIVGTLWPVARTYWASAFVAPFDLAIRVLLLPVPTRLRILRYELEDRRAEAAFRVAGLDTELSNTRVKLSDLVKTAVNLVVAGERDPVFDAVVPEGADTALLTEGDFYLIRTKAFKRLQSALKDRDQCTVGVSGERGAGKTSAMRLLLREREVTKNSLTLWIHAPTTYNEKEFLTSLLVRLITKAMNVLRLSARQILNPLEQQRRRDEEEARHRRSVVRALGVAILVALGLFFHQVVKAFVDDGTAVWFLRATEPDVLALFGGLLMGIVFLWSVRTRLNLHREPSDDLSVHSESLLRRLWYQVKESTSTGVSGQMPGLSFFTSSSTEYGRVPISVPDLVEEYRRYVRRLKGEKPRRPLSGDRLADDVDVLEPAPDRIERVVIFLDELDKVGKFENVELVLRYVKILFGKNTCFFASISEDARDKFARRTVGERDIFDSSFGEVITLERHSYQEISDIINARVQGNLPVPFHFLVYCVSKGNVRDAIRVARDLLENHQGRTDFWQLSAGLLYGYLLKPMIEVHRIHLEEAINESTGSFRENLRTLVNDLAELGQSFRRTEVSASVYHRELRECLQRLQARVRSVDSGGYGISTAAVAMMTAVECFLKATKRTYTGWHKMPDAWAKVVRSIDLAGKDEPAALVLLNEAREEHKLPPIEWGSLTQGNGHTVAKRPPARSKAKVATKPGAAAKRAAKRTNSSPKS